MLARWLIAITAVFVTSVVSAAPKPLEVPTRRLIANPEQFAGKTVAVTGWFECAFEAGCELRFNRTAQERLKTIDLDFPDDLAAALDKTHPLSGWLHVVGRFEYSRPFPDIVHPSPRRTKPLPKGEVERQIVTVWQGFGFRACQIKVTHFERI